MSSPWSDPEHDVMGDILEARQRARDESQLADTSDRAVNLSEFNLGFSAGWRGDELVTPKSSSYLAGFDAGSAAKVIVG